MSGGYKHSVHYLNVYWTCRIKEWKSTQYRWQLLSGECKFLSDGPIGLVESPLALSVSDTCHCLQSLNQYTQPYFLYVFSHVQSTSVMLGHLCCNHINAGAL